MITKFNLYESTDYEIIFKYINMDVDIYLIKNWIHENKDKINITNIDGWTPLLMASSYNRYELIKLFIDNGADINHTIDYGDNALIIYCYYVGINVKYDIIKLFLENSIDWKLLNNNFMFLDKIQYSMNFSMVNKIEKAYPEIKIFHDKLVNKRENAKRKKQI